MDKSRVIKMAVLALVVFGLGIGFALWRRNHVAEQQEETRKPWSAPAQTTSTPDSKEKSETPPPTISSAPTAAAGLPTIDAGKIIPDAPPMPPIRGASVTAVPQAASTDKPVETPPAAAAQTATQAPPVAGAKVGGPFTLTDQTGKEVTEKSWPGKYKLVFFGFTQCTDTCPQTLQRIKLVMNDAVGAKLQPLFITTDPANDTKDVMALYMGGYAPVIGLTGTKEQIEATEKTYNVYVNGPDHSAYIYLMSPDDQPLEILAAEAPAEEMIAKIKAKVQ
jgi:protein SCO1/2